MRRLPSTWGVPLAAVVVVAQAMALTAGCAVEDPDMAPAPAPGPDALVGALGETTCNHDLCATGAPLGSSCHACAAAICAVDWVCCTYVWDSICVGEVASVCGVTCPSPDCHDVCETGASQAASCGGCVATICASDSFCCDTAWDGLCVQEVATTCGDCSCIHGPFEVGAPLLATCGCCTSSVCTADPFCCQNAWDPACVGEAQTYCAGPCCGNGVCAPPETCSITGEDGCRADCGLCACADGIDNDGDANTDYPNDPGCVSITDSSEVDPPLPPECSDGLDNDSDFTADWPADDGCDSAADGSE